MKNVLERIGEILNMAPSVPENMARPAAAPPRVEGPGGDNPQSSGNLAGAINSGEFGPPSRKSPMDHVKVIKPAHDVLHSVPCPPEATFVAIGRTCGLKISPTLVAQVKALDDEWTRCLDVILASYTVTNHDALIPLVATFGLVPFWRFVK